MTAAAQRLALGPELTVLHTAATHAELVRALRGGPDGVRPGALELDLSQVVEFDCAGVQLLLAARREALAAGRAFQVSGHTAVVRRVLELLQLDDEFAPRPAHQR